MEKLTCGYLAMRPIPDLGLNDLFAVHYTEYSEYEKLQLDLLNATVLHPLAVKYPRQSNYNKLLLMTIVKLVENDNIKTMIPDIEVIPIMYDMLTHLLSGDGGKLVTISASHTTGGDVPSHHNAASATTAESDANSSNSSSSDDDIGDEYFYRTYKIPIISCESDNNFCGGDNDKGYSVKNGTSGDKGNDKNFLERVENNGRHVMCGNNSTTISNTVDSVLTTNSHLEVKHCHLREECHDVVDCWMEENAEDGYLWVTLKETNKLVAHGTTGLRTWQASHVLLAHLLERPRLLQRQRVLEVGCGLGLLGLCIALCGLPDSCHLTDCHDRVLETLRGNVKRNVPRGHKVQVSVGRLDWEEEQQRSHEFDIVIGADVVFDPTLYDPLLRTIRAALTSDTSCTVPEAKALVTEDENDHNKSQMGIKTIEYHGITSTREMKSSEVTSPMSSTSVSSGSNKLAILAATIRNSEALKDFLSRLAAHHLIITAAHEAVYQASVSEAPHTVRIFYIRLNN